MTVREAISLYYRSIRHEDAEATAAVLAGVHGSAVREHLAEAGRSMSRADRLRASAAGTEARWGKHLLSKEAREHGLSPALVRNRMIQGWSRNDALNTPVRRKKVVDKT